MQWAAVSTQSAEMSDPVQDPLKIDKNYFWAFEIFNYLSDLTNTTQGNWLGTAAAPLITLLPSASTGMFSSPQSG